MVEAQAHCITLWTLNPSRGRTERRRFASCISPLFQSESKCEAFDMEIRFIHM